MRILLTRAVEDARRTRMRLETAGHRVVLSPLLVIQTLPAAWPAERADAILATSAHAFAAPLPGAGAGERRALPLYLVGTRTGEAARRHGFDGPATVAPDAAALARAIPAAPRRRFVYLAGRVRKLDLEAALARDGHGVDVVETYAAEAVAALTAEAATALASREIDAVLHYSRRSAEAFLAAAAAGDAEEPAHFCLSQDCAAPLRAAGCAVVQVAASPDEDALLAALLRHARQAGE